MGGEFLIQGIDAAIESLIQGVDPLIQGIDAAIESLIQSLDPLIQGVDAAIESLIQSLDPPGQFVAKAVYFLIKMDHHLPQLAEPPGVLLNLSLEIRDSFFQGSRHGLLLTASLIARLRTVPLPCT